MVGVVRLIWSNGRGRGEATKVLVPLLLLLLVVVARCRGGEARGDGGVAGAVSLLPSSCGVKRIIWA